MRWSFALLICTVTLFTSGCKNRATPLSNPFLAPDRVPPPATRTLVPGTAVPYYNDSQQVAPSVTEPLSNTLTPQTGMATTRPGGGSFTKIEPTSTHISNNSFRGDRVSVPTDKQVARFETESQKTARGSEPRWSDVQSPVAELPEPAPMVRASVTGSASTQRASVFASGSPALAVDGSNHRAHNSGRWLQPDFSARPNNSPNQNHFEQTTPRYYEAPPDEWNSPPTQASYMAEESVPSTQASYMAEESVPSERSTSPVGFRRSTTDSAPRPTARFGFESDYSWLKGRLEWSEATKQWKLRYIPIDGTTDAFGGSVVISNPQILHDLQPGDFVETRGTIDKRELDDLSFAASYRVTSIRALAD